MNNFDFITLYLPALKEALGSKKSESWKGPEYYIEDKYILEIETFIDSNEELRDWLDFIDSYFDAKAHNFIEAIDGISISDAKDILLQSIEFFEIYDIADAMQRFRNKLKSHKSNT